MNEKPSRINQDLKGPTTEFRLHVADYSAIIYAYLTNEQHETGVHCEVSSANLAQDMCIPSHPNSGDSSWHFYFFTSISLRKVIFL